MKKKKDLLLIVDHFPLMTGATFIETEVRFLAEHFSHIHILALPTNIQVELPENCSVHYESRRQERGSIMRFLAALMHKPFRQELLSLFGQEASVIKCIKIMTVDWYRSSEIIFQLSSLIKAHNLNLGSTLFYSYWHDYKALALSRLRKGNSDLRCIARAHGWDVFRERQKIPYLPFKPFILENLSKTYSISEAGKSELQHYTDKKDCISVSRLGTREPLKKSEKDSGDKFTICSCSSLVEVKRVDLIIESLSKLKEKNVRWIHFGNGPLREKLESMANQKLLEIEHEFRGKIDNEKLHEFYASNRVDLFINLSSSEGIPVSFMEAMSYGIPVMSTDVGGVSEIVREKNGFLLQAEIKPEQVAMNLDDCIANDKVLSLKKVESKNLWKIFCSADANYSKFLGEIGSI